MKQFYLILALLGVTLCMVAEDGDPIQPFAEVTQNGLIFKLYSPQDSESYAELSGNTLSEPTDLEIPAAISKDGISYPVTVIAKNAFRQCEFINSVTIPNSVTSIGTYAFWRSTLSSVTISNSLTTISSYAFGGCDGLTTVTLPNSVTTLERGAFFWCKNLISINLDESLETIGDGAFNACLALSSVVIPNSVKTIGEIAFEGCTALQEVTLPNSISAIGNNAFEATSQLSTIYYKTTNPINIDHEIFGGYPEYLYSSATLVVATGGLLNAKHTNPWRKFTHIIESDFSRVEEAVVEHETDAPVEVYNLAGMRIGDTTEGLPTGLYIVRQGGTARKVTVN